MPSLQDNLFGDVKQFAATKAPAPYASVEDTSVAVACDWTPEPLPTLQRDEWIGFDFEYKPGSNPTKDKPFAFSLWSPQRRKGWFAPWGCKGGGNLDEDVCLRWLGTELQGRNVVGLNLKAELHQLYNLGLDPERLQIKPHDVAFNAALLNEYRLGGFSLEALAAEYLLEGERKVHPAGVHPSKFYLAHAGQIAERGISDSFLAWRIHECTQQAIKAEELERCLDLENSIINAVVLMERTGALLDRGKFSSSCVGLVPVESRSSQPLIEAFHREYGIEVHPGKRPSMVALFKKLGISTELATAWNDKKNCYEQKFSEEALKNVIKITKRRVISDVLKLRSWQSMKSKFIDKFLNKMDSKNVQTTLTVRP